MSEATPPEVYLGTMSGTSMDGLDLAAVSFHDQHRPTLLASATIGYPQDLQSDLLALATDAQATVNQLGELDVRLGEFYATRIDEFIHEHGLHQRIRAIGSHGQTVRHRPGGRYPHTLQIGDPNIIAARTGIPVVADLRRRDLALRGQGAPFAPAFHNRVFRNNSLNRVIINIGGIANITWLPADPAAPVAGFDTGPGNTLLDYLSREKLQSRYDDQGRVAASGSIDKTRLRRVLATEPYFQKAPPKTTGTDYFSPRWLKESGLAQLDIADAMTTLAELTVITIANGIQALPDAVDEAFVCGGGSHNLHLMSRLRQHLEFPLDSTMALGIDPDLVEAMTFAWLARQTLNHEPGNLPSVTSAEKFTILGAVYYA